MVGDQKVDIQTEKRVKRLLTWSFESATYKTAEDLSVWITFVFFVGFLFSFLFSIF